VEARLQSADGTDLWGLVRAAPLPDIAGRSGLLCQILDITESRAGVEALEERARRDPLTGLPNRIVVLDRLAEVVHDAAASQLTGALLFCDLDNFKTINDEQGHLVGDDVLAELSHRLGSVVREEDTAGRFGGDEFVIVSYPVTAGAAKALGDRVSEALSEPMVCNSSVLSVSVSIGIALITGSVEPAEVLRRADAAMYAVRSRRHRPTFVVDTA
jgi:diguanylate cyclase (GGDEF)-like protein